MVTVEIALEYRRRGWSVIPLKAADDDPGKRKIAQGRWTSFQNQPPLDKDVKRWFGGGRERGIAVVLGDVSGGLVCRDFDKLQAYATWANAFPELARTLPTVATGDDGRHVYCRSRTSISDLRRQGILSGNAYFPYEDGECRIDRSYCALPPTLHPNGKRYGWLNAPKEQIPQVDFLEAGFRQSWDVTERDREDQRRHRTTECHSKRESKLSSPSDVERGDLTNIPDDLANNTRSPSDEAEHWTELSPVLHDAIISTLPKQMGQRNRQLFEFARTLKAFPELADAQPADLRDYVKQWHALALPVIGTKPFEDTWIEFIRGWKRVKFPKGQEPMMQIVCRASANPPPPESDMYDAPSTRKLLAICRELARSSSTGIFYLSVRTAGRLIDVSHMQASRLFEMMQVDGLLAVIELGSNKTQKATRFRYLGSM